MSNHHVYVIAEFLPIENQEEKLFELLNQLAILTLKNEKNCLEYVVTKQIKHPDAPHESKYKIVSIEEFKDKDAFDQHCRAEYVRDFIEKYIESESKIVQDFCVRLFE